MNRPRSSRLRYLSFVEDYRRRVPESPSKNSREDLGQYLRWLWPHRYAAGALLALAVLAAGLQMVEPLFMRYIVDRVLLIQGLDRAARFRRLNLAGGLFVSLIVLSNAVVALKDYCPRLLNTQGMLQLLRSMCERVLHLPLPTCADTHTPGHVSR